jgi:hypothetical protein
VVDSRGNYWEKGNEKSREQRMGSTWETPSLRREKEGRGWMSRNLDTNMGTDSWKRERPRLQQLQTFPENSAK